MNNIISTIEIALLIILPLIIYYRRLNLKTVSIIKNIVLLYFIWFSTYTLMHELFHLFVAWIIGANVIDYQLMSKLWEGGYKTGLIRTNYNSSLHELIVVIVPYLRDIILLFVGIVLVKMLNTSYYLPDGLIIIIFILNPIYDIINNYFSFILTSLNDFNALKNYVGSFGSNFIGISFTIFAITINILAFRILSKKTIMI